MLPRTALYFALGLITLSVAAPVFAQQVGLPAPRLLTVTPMGGQVGTSVEVSVTHQNIETVTELLFSTPKITAKPVVAQDGKLLPNKFLVTIEPDAPTCTHDARALSRLGVSAARAFSVGSLPEVTRTKANNSLETAFPLQLNSVCNTATSKKAIDFYSFQGVKDRRVCVDCNAMGIDSKLNPVVIIADSTGHDLLVNRIGGGLDFTPPSDGTYLIKIHGLTFQGGPEYFYRLALQEVSGSGPAPSQEITAKVSAFSWPPEGLSRTAETTEIEPNNEPAQAQLISLPCDISGSFFPANDVDIFEFLAKKGEVWWVEVASERLGQNTDPFALVQRVSKAGDNETLTDVGELDDISSPMKPGTYLAASTYNGPPYDAGSPDALGKIEIKEDGVYRLQLHDLLGGTRSDADNIYRLVIRQAAPDFSLVAWASHMTVRQNDFGTMSKPLALRAGATMAFEVVVVRRDGFDGEIELGMEDLPPGVSAMGLKIPAGKVQGMLFVTADETAKPAFSIAKIIGRAKISGSSVTRTCRLASMVWPVEYAPSDFPKSRLMADVPVSVTDSEMAPVSIAAEGNKVWDANPGETLKIPLRITWRNEFNGTSIKLKAYGTVFGAMKEIDLPIKAAKSEAVIDLAALKTPPGDYTLAFNGIGITKYRPIQDALKLAEEEQKKAGEEVTALTATAKAMAEKVSGASAEEKVEATNAAKSAVAKQKLAETALAEATKRLKTATDAAAPKDILDIFVSEPIRISVKAAQVVNAPGVSPQK